MSRLRSYKKIWIKTNTKIISNNKKSKMLNNSNLNNLDKISKKMS